MADNKGFDLSALLKNVSIPDTQEQLRYIPYDQLVPDPGNGYSMDGLDDLARSIEIAGLLQPLRVTPLGPERYRISAGHRRHAAIGQLISRGSKQFADGVPCVVDLAAGSEAWQELRLLLANADNRKMTAADEAQQMERISDCLRRLEDEGYQFEGRHRDWVSKLSGMSRTKIGRLQAIKRNLSPSWLALFEEGKLTETAAYELQKAPAKYQELLMRCCREHKPRTSPGKLTSYTMQAYVKTCEWAEQLKCPKDETPCQWREHLVEKAYERPEYSNWMCPVSRSNRCCAYCQNLGKCEHVCPKLREQAAEDREKLAAQAAERERESEESRLRYERQQADIKDAELEDWARFGARRRQLGLTIAQAYGLDTEEAAAVDGFEEGKAEPPFDGVVYWEPDELVALADRLRCSVDWILGRTEIPEVNTGAGSGWPRWQTGTPPRDGRYMILLRGNADAADEPDKEFRADLRDGGWYLFDRPMIKGMIVTAWYPLPDAKED